MFSTVPLRAAGIEYIGMHPSVLFELFMFRCRQGLINTQLLFSLKQGCNIKENYVYN